MNLVDAFLLVSGVAYLCAVFLPKPCTRNISNIWIEKLLMLIAGTILLSNLLLFNISWIWIGLCLGWTFAALLSYLGYSKWNILWRKDLSDEAQVFMACWDLAIAVCCMIKF